MQIKLSRSVIRHLIKELRSAGRREIGGILLAENTAPNEFTIIDISVDQTSGSTASFRRKPEFHKAASDAFFAKTGHDYSRFNYLGEWHSHPSFAPVPSASDRAEMASLVEDRQTEIPFALLLIVRLRLHFWMDASATFFARGQAPQPATLIQL